MLPVCYTRELPPGRPTAACSINQAETRELLPLLGRQHVRAPDALVLERHGGEAVPPHIRLVERQVSPFVRRGVGSDFAFLPRLHVGGVPAAWPEEKLAPLVAYIETLRAPANPTPPASVEVEAGQALFETAGCTTCHGGPAGGGTKTYAFEEIGTDSELAKWLDPKLSGKACCGATLEPGETLSHGVKSPRLVGAWAMSRFLHNGSVSTLEELFCVNGPRGAVTEPAYRDGGHAFTCDGLTPSEKQSLIAYLRAR